MSFVRATWITALVLFLGASGQAAELKVGDIAPEIVLEGILPSGEPLLTAINRSPGENQSYTLIEFFETEDAESNQNLSALFELSLDIETYVQLRLVAINKEIADVKAYVKNNLSDIRFPVHFDDAQDAKRAYGVTKVPTIFVLKNEKEVIFKHVGVITDEVRKQILTAVGF